MKLADSRPPLMKELRLILDQQLSRLGAQGVWLDGTITEIYRRYGVLDDVESWNLLAPEEITQDNGMDHLSEFGEQEVESSVGRVQEEELEAKPAETRIFDANGLPLRARDMFKQQTIPA